MGIFGAKEELVRFLEKNLNEQFIADFQGKTNNVGEWQRLAQELADAGIVKVNKKFLIDRENQRPTHKHKYGQYKNVLLTEEEHDKLLNKENGEKAIEYLSEYRAYKGYKAKSDYLAILKWVFDAVKEQEQKKARIGQYEAQKKHNRFTENDRSTEEYISGYISDDELENIQV